MSPCSEVTVVDSAISVPGSASGKTRVSVSENMHIGCKLQLAPAAAAPDGAAVGTAAMIPQCCHVTFAAAIYDSEVTSKTVSERASKGFRSGYQKKIVSVRYRISNSRRLLVQRCAVHSLGRTVAFFLGKCNL